MSVQSLLHYLGPHVATLVVGLVSALIPVVNIELFLIGAAAVASSDYPVWTLGVAAALGQMIGKCVLYWSAGTALDSRLGRKFSRERVEALRRRMAAMNSLVLTGFTFVSASTGVPPFLLFSILAGLTRMNFWQFAVTGFAGRALRLVAVVAFPHAIKGLFL